MNIKRPFKLVTMIKTNQRARTRVTVASRPNTQVNPMRTLIRAYIAMLDRLDPVNTLSDKVVEDLILTTIITNRIVFASSIAPMGAANVPINTYGELTKHISLLP
jgi:hypothetical protein